MQSSMGSSPIAARPALPNSCSIASRFGQAAGRPPHGLAEGRQDRDQGGYNAAVLFE